MVKRKDNPANNPNQRSLFDADGNIRPDIYEESVGLLDEKNKEKNDLNFYNWKEFIESSDKFKNEYLKYISKDTNKETFEDYLNSLNLYKDIRKIVSTNIEDDNHEFETYIENLIDEKVEAKVKEELDRRLGKEDEDEDEILFEGSGIVSNVYEEYMKANKQSKPDIVYRDENGNTHTIEIKTNRNKNEDKSDYFKTFLANGLAYDRDTTLKIFSDNIRKTLNTQSLMTLSKFKVKSRVKEVLEEQGQTVSHLVRMTGVSRSTINSILTNSNEISLKNAYKISLVLGKPIEELFPFIIDMTDNTDNEE